MGVYTLVPVKEALDIDLIADFEILHSLVNLCVRAAKIGLNEELIFLAVKLYVEVEIVSLGACAVPFIEICNVVAVDILGSRNRQSLEGNELVLEFDKLFFVCKNLCCVFCFRNILAFKKLNLCGSLRKFNFAFPFGLGTRDFYLLAYLKLCIFFRSAFNSVCKVAALGILKIKRRVSVLLGIELLCLDVSLDYDLGVYGRREILAVCHNAL